MNALHLEIFLFSLKPYITDCLYINKDKSTEWKHSIDFSIS